MTAESQERNWVRLALWAVGLIAAGWILGRFRTLVILTVVVAIITFPIFPLVDWFQRRGRMPRSAAAALVLLGVTVFLLVALAVVIPWVLHQGQLLISIAPRGIAAVTEYLAQWEARVGEPTFPQFLRTAWQRAGETAVGAANAAAARAMNLMVGWFGQIYLLLLVPFVIYFVLMDYRETRQAVLSLISQPGRARVEHLLANLTVTLRWGLWAQVVVSSAVGALTAAGLAVAGVPSPLAIGLFAAVAEAIPYVGGFATYVVALLVAIPKGGPVWIWAVIVGQLFGLLGMFFAVPAVVVMREILAEARVSAAR